MTADILGVHGIWNFTSTVEDNAAVALALQWADALGVEADSVAAAYYAHHLRLGHHGPSDDLDALDAALYGLPRELLEALMHQLGWAQGAPQGRALAPLRQLASWFVTRYGADQSVVERYLAPLLVEVALYFDSRDPGRRQAVHTTIGAALSLHRPRVVVAHSLGSVATYETLWAYPRLNVELLVTIGSPLAFPDHIFPRLRPAPVGGRGARPPGVRKWINIADPADLVALPRGLSNHFDGVDKDLETPAGSMFTHKATAYLRTRELRGIVTEHLQHRRSR
jgi:hypothetical protein